MNSILKLRDSDPHDDFGISPDIVPATWADKVLADIERDSKTRPLIIPGAAVRISRSLREPAPPPAPPNRIFARPPPAISRSRTSISATSGPPAGQRPEAG